MEQKIIIGIPIYNEENNIINTLDSLYQSLTHINYQYKIILAFNGTTDNGLEIVNKKQYKNMEILSLNTIGKSNAMIEILKYKSYLTFFIDGDCIVDKYCIKSIITKFKNKSILCVTGNPVPKKSKKIIYNILNIRMIYPKSEIAKIQLNNNSCKPFIHGRIFAIRNTTLINKKINNSNFKNSKGDDSYLSRFFIYNFGRNSLYKSYSSKVYYVPVSNIKSWWQKWTRIWSQVDNISILNPEFKPLEKYMKTKLDWSFVVKQNFKIIFYFISERLLNYSGKILYSILKNKIKFDWVRLEETKKRL